VIACFRNIKPVPFSVLSGTNTYTGNTTISAGTLAFSSLSALPNVNTLSIAGSATLALHAGGASGFTADDIAMLLGSGALPAGSALGIDTTNAGGSFCYTGNITGAIGLTKLGGGTLILSGTNTYTRNTTISGGTLAVSGGAAIPGSGTVVLADVSGAALSLLSDQTIGSLAGGGASGGNVDLGEFALTVGANNASTTYAGAISGSGSLTKVGSGILTLAGANTYTGGTIIAGSVLAIGADDALPLTGEPSAWATKSSARASWTSMATTSRCRASIRLPRAPVTAPSGTRSSTPAPRPRN